MASTRDIHDIMGMGGGPVQKPPNKKKKKVVEQQPRLSGISREVQALMGDSVPPVQIVEAPKYKSKPSLTAKLYRPRHWEERGFVPGARADGLELRHWKRALPIQRPQPTNGDTEMVDGDKESVKADFTFEDEFPMDKWNVAVRIPQYTDEQYEKHHKTDDWSKEETDYLMHLATNYDLRWILISDRYDPQDVQPPPTQPDTMELARTYPPRSMEQLKQRYYQIAAQDLESRTPKSTMNPTEFQLWEKMRNFDAKSETVRKSMAEKLFERTKDEADEERTLLEELHRITKNEEDFISMRRDLYARLESAPSLRRNERGEEQNIVLSSLGLSDLLNRLFAKEKSMKRRTLPNGEAAPNSAAQQTPVDARGRQAPPSRRDTLETPTTESQKKASAPAPVPKQLSKADEEKYGVSHPTERLTSGVSFRHEKINRITTAKSQVQTQKLNAALTELEIPARLSMPTEKVCKEFERLVGQIQLLLDARKTLTRVSEEVKVLEEVRRQRLGEPAPSQEEGTDGNTADADKATSQSVPARPDQAQIDRNTQNMADMIKKEKSSGDDNDEGPGPAVNEGEDDAEAADEADTTNADRTQVDDDDDDQDQDETNVDDSTMRKEDADDDEDDEAENEVEDAEEEAEQEEDQEEEDEEDEEEDDDEGTAALRRGAENDDGEDEEDEEADEDDEVEADEDEDTAQANGTNADENDEEDEEEEEEEEGDEEDVTMNEVEPAAGDPDMNADDEEEVEESRPTSAGSRSHKRGASIISDASGAGSNRSGIGRKRKR